MAERTNRDRPSLNTKTDVVQVHVRTRIEHRDRRAMAGIGITQHDHRSRVRGGVADASELHAQIRFVRRLHAIDPDRIVGLNLDFDGIARGYIIGERTDGPGSCLLGPGWRHVHHRFQACIEVAMKKMSTKKTISTIDVMSIKSSGCFSAGGNSSAFWVEKGPPPDTS